MATVYVAANSNGPYAAHKSLGLAQAAVEADRRRCEPHPTDYRWDEEVGAHGTRTWQLRAKGLSGRWGKAYHSIHEIPLS
nr:hypothetical protein KPHV_60430 [Kitasatospora purpeofusca]